MACKRCASLRSLKTTFSVVPGYWRILKNYDVFLGACQTGQVRCLARCEPRLTEYATQPRAAAASLSWCRARFPPLERARDLATPDFVSLLFDVMPDDTIANCRVTCRRR